MSQLSCAPEMCIVSKERNVPHENHRDLSRRLLDHIGFVGPRFRIGYDWPPYVGTEHSNVHFHRLESVRHLRTPEARTEKIMRCVANIFAMLGQSDGPDISTCPR